MTDREQSQHEEALKLLEDYRAGKVSDSSYGSMIVQWGKAHLLEARPDIELFLQNQDAGVRGRAVYVLAGRFRLQDYWPVAVHFLLYDPEYQARVDGVTALAWLKDNTGDQQTLGVLASIVRDPYDNEMIRRDSYRAMHMVAFGNSKPLEEDFDLERDANWNFVNASVDPALEAAWRATAQDWLERYRAGKIAEQNYYEMLLRFGRTHLQEASNVVKSFLTSSTLLLRQTALRVLVLYLQVPGNWQVAVDALHNDSDADYQETAIETLGLLMRNTHDKATLRVLEQYTEDDDLWAGAWDSMRKVYSGDSKKLIAFLASPDN